MRNLRKGFGIIALVAIMLSAISCSEGGGTSMFAPKVPDDRGTVDQTMPTILELYQNKGGATFIKTSKNEQLYYDALGVFLAEDYGKASFNLANTFNYSASGPIGLALSSVTQTIPSANISRALNEGGDPTGYYNPYKIFTSIQDFKKGPPKDFTEEKTGYVDGWIIGRRNALDKNEDEDQLGTAFNIDMRIEFPSEYLSINKIAGVILYSAKGQTTEEAKQSLIRGDISAKGNLLLDNGSPEGAIILSFDYLSIGDRIHKASTYSDLLNDEYQKTPTGGGFPYTNEFGHLYGDGLSVSLYDGTKDANGKAKAISLATPTAPTTDQEKQLKDKVYMLLEDLFIDIMTNQKQIGLLAGI